MFKSHLSGVGVNTQNGTSYMTHLAQKIPSLLCAATMVWSFSATALAEVRSQPTSPVVGQAPDVITPARIDHSDLNGDGIVSVGDRLFITWRLNTEVSDPDGDALTMPRFEWFADGQPAGNNYALDITEAHQGKKITANAYARTDPNITEPFESTEGPATINPAMGVSEIIVAVNGAPTGLNVTGLVDGYPKVGQKLTAEPSCIGPCGELTYKWAVESAVGSDTYNVIAGATANTYTPVKGDQKRHIQITVKQP